jgi:hypothetical protein
VSEG